MQSQIPMNQTVPKTTPPIIRYTDLPIKTRPDVLLHDVNQAAVHESGHFVVAEHYGLASHIELTNQLELIGDKYRDFTTVKGQAFYQATNKHFALSVCGWGGLVAEVAVSEEIADAERLAIATREQIDQCELDISHSDADRIFGHPQPWRALKAAARIVIARRARIDAITRLALRHMIDEKGMSFNYPALHTNTN